MIFWCINNYIFYKAGDTVYNRAEGATYPETLRQKDRGKNTLENELLALPKVQVLQLNSQVQRQRGKKGKHSFA